jgi:hypothetical protein
MNSRNRSPKQPKPSTAFQYFENLMAKKPIVPSENTERRPVDIGGHSVYEDDVISEQFGSIVAITESYNCYIKLYETLMDEVSIDEDVKFSRIDFYQFVEELRANDFGTLYKIIETLLRIILNDEECFKKLYMFNVNLARSYASSRILNKFTMQEFCRVVVQFDEYLDDETDRAKASSNFALRQVNCLRFEPDKVSLLRVTHFFALIPIPVHLKGARQEISH